MSAESVGAEVGGFVAPGFEPVAEAVGAAVASGGETGLGVAATVAGQTVVDVWCGVAEAEAHTAWSADTLAVVYSCTKGMATLCAQLLADRGLLDVDAPVASYWPEFAAEGKAKAKVRHILNHTVGVLTFPRYWELIEPDGRGFERSEEIEERIAATAPAWEPGTQAAYHALTFGWLVGGLVRRIDGRSIGRFFAEEVAGPLGLSLWIGLPDECQPRVATVRMGDQPGEADAAAMREAVERARAELLEGRMETIEALWLASFLMPPVLEDVGDWLVDIMNRPWVRSAEIAGGNAVGNAAGLAGMYAPLAAGGGGLVSPEAVEQFNTPHPLPDGTPTGYCLGYAYLGDVLQEGGPSPKSFGHGGAGGNLGFADPERGLSFGLVKNRLQPDTATAERVVRALYGSLS